MACIVRLLLILNFSFQTGSCYVAQVGVELVMLLPWPPKCHQLCCCVRSTSTNLYKRMATGIVNGFWYLSSVSSHRVVRS